MAGLPKDETSVCPAFFSSNRSKGKEVVDQRAIAISIGN
jgi:hypothetical protein